jgi:hypothetical protein
MRSFSQGVAYQVFQGGFVPLEPWRRPTAAPRSVSRCSRVPTCPMSCSSPSTSRSCASSATSRLRSKGDANTARKREKMLAVPPLRAASRRAPEVDRDREAARICPAPITTSSYTEINVSAGRPIWQPPTATQAMTNLIAPPNGSRTGTPASFARASTQASTSRQPEPSIARGNGEARGAPLVGSLMCAINFSLRQLC